PATGVPASFRPRSRGGNTGDRCCVCPAVAFVSLLYPRINSLACELSIVQTLTQLTCWICLGILPFCCAHTWVAPLILWFGFRRRSRAHNRSSLAPSAREATIAL